MAHVQFNNQGVPLMAYGKKYFATTTSVFKPRVSEQTEEVENKITIGDHEIAEWGTGNEFPKTANDIIRAVGVLNTGLKFIRNFTLGQGIFPCRVKDYDEKGNEILEVINDKELISFCDGRMVRRYLEKLLREIGRAHV